MNLEVLFEAKVEPGQDPKDIVRVTVVGFLTFSNTARWERQYQAVEVKERKGLLGTRKKFQCSHCGAVSITTYDLVVIDMRSAEGDRVAAGKPRKFKPRDLPGFGVSTYGYDFFTTFCEKCREVKVAIQVAHAVWD